MIVLFRETVHGACFQFFKIYIIKNISLMFQVFTSISRWCKTRSCFKNSNETGLRIKKACLFVAFQKLLFPYWNFYCSENINKWLLRNVFRNVFFTFFLLGSVFFALICWTFNIVTSKCLFLLMSWSKPLRKATKIIS